MINISFDNAYYLLIAIPLLALVLTPFFIAIRKENKSKSVVASLVLHLMIVLLVAFAAAGPEATAVITQTQVYVVADVSYSSSRNLDTVNEYIREVERSLPDNSQMGIVAFGKDYKLVGKMGEGYKSVKDSGVDDSATDIAAALDYASTLFKGDALKKIVLITDGKLTDTDGLNGLITTIENLYSQNISIDAMYLDNNLSPDAKEVQISSVDYTQSTYLNHESTASVLVQSSYDVQAILSISQNGTELEENRQAVKLTRGYNIVNFSLPTSQEGDFDYEISLYGLNGEDESAHNNAYGFTQSVAGKLQVLLLSENVADKAAIEAQYGDSAEITAPRVGQDAVPYTVEDLCQYDEIILSNIDVRNINNVETFVESLDAVVSQFGKSLVTMGDLKIQNKTDDVLKDLEDMLPVKFGNDDKNVKVLGIVIDISLSMDQISHLIMAKRAAIQLINLLGENDWVSVMAFSGVVEPVCAPTLVGSSVNRAELADKINALEPKHGTLIGSGMKAMHDQLKTLSEKLPSITNRQVMLLSDGMSYSAESEEVYEVTTDLKNIGIPTSVINTGCTDEEGVTRLSEIARLGTGEYYFVDRIESLSEVMLTEIADDVTETLVEVESALKVNRPNDDVLDGVEGISTVKGYIYSTAKTSATTVLSTEYTSKGGTTTQPPVYSYWNYGNGMVSTFTSSIGGDWTSHWNEAGANRFFDNILDENTPSERIDHPYTLSVEYDGAYAHVEIVPATLDPDAIATGTIKLIPTNGAAAQEGAESEDEGIAATLTFDGSRYFYKFPVSEVGKYQLNIRYAYAGIEKNAEYFFTVSYAPEYDSFQTFSPSDLHKAVRNRGTVTEDGTVNLEHDEDEVSTYTVHLTVWLMLIAIVLFIADIIVRKIKWKDITGLFKRSKTRKGGKA